MRKPESAQVVKPNRQMAGRVEWSVRIPGRSHSDLEPYRSFPLACDFGVSTFLDESNRVFREKITSHDKQHPALGHLHFLHGYIKYIGRIGRSGRRTGSRGIRSGREG